MNTVQYILMVLLSLPASYYDKESPEERRDRMEVIARAIGDASARATCDERFDKPECEPIWKSNRKQLILLLVTKAWWESRLAQNVHEGNCRKTECDPTKMPGGNIIHRARTIWQMQKTGLVSRDEWNTMVGTDFEATRTAAWVATKILSRGKRVCHTPYGALSYYGRSRCDWNGAKPRVIFYRKLKDKTPEQFKKDAEKRMSVLSGNGGRAQP
jgi:hypothetical protein